MITTIFTIPYLHMWDVDGEEIIFKDLMYGIGMNNIDQASEFCREQAISDRLQESWVNNFAALTS